VAWYSLPFVGSLPSGYDPPRHVCAYPTNPALPIPYPGMYGQSSVREVALDTGAALRTKALARSEFGEGLVKVGNRCAAAPWLGTRSPKPITGHPARASGLLVVRLVRVSAHTLFWGPTAWEAVDAGCRW